jgi:branched-chain amino acid transport system substrate-binding protein
MNRNRIALIAALACAASATPAFAEIKIGLNFPSTGPFAIFGVPMSKTVPLLPKTIGGEPVTYIVLDSNSDATKSAANTRKLVIEDKVDVLIGEGTTPGSLAMIDIAAEAKTAMVAPTATTQLVEPMDERRRWVFKIVPNDDIGADTVAKHMAQNGVKTVGFIGFNDAYGQTWLELLKDRLPKAGIKVVAEEFYARTDTSVTAQALKIIAAKPDVAFNGAGGTPAIVPTHDLRARGFTGPIYQTHGVSSREFIERGGKDVDGNFFAGEPFTIYKDLPADNPWHKIAKQYVDAYKAANGSEPPIFGAHMFDSVKLIEPAIEAALKKGAKPGTEEFRTLIRDGMENAKNVYLNNGLLAANSPTNHAAFSADGMFMIKIENGDFHLIK